MEPLRDIINDNERFIKPSIDIVNNVIDPDKADDIASRIEDKLRKGGAYNVEKWHKFYCQVAYALGEDISLIDKCITDACEKSRKNPGELFHYLARKEMQKRGRLK